MTWHALVDPAFSGRLCLTLLHSVWQVALLALVVWCVDRLWRNHSVQRRYAVNVAALVAALLAMAITYGLIDVARPPSDAAMELPALATAVESEPSSMTTPPVATELDAAVETHTADPPLEFDSPTPASTAGDSSSVAQSSDKSSPRWLLLAPWIVAFYGAGVVFMLARLVVAVIRANRLGAHADLVIDGPLVEALRSLCHQWSMKVVPALARAEQMVVPKVVGLVRPTILLPASAISGLTMDELEMILAHELAHVRRYDMWVNLLQRLAEAVLFFNPALWYFSRRISTLREYCCDEMTCRAQSASAPDRRVRYATALLRVVELTKPDSATNNDLASLAASGRSPSEIRRRVARLFGESLREPLRVSRGTVLTLILLVASLAIGLPVWNTQADPPADRADSPSASDANHNDVPFDFRLTVVGPNKAPVPNLSVEFRTEPLLTADQINRGRFVRAVTYAVIAKTDDKGRLAVTLPSRPEKFFISIEQPGYGPYLADWSSTFNPQVIPQEFTAKLDEGWSMGGVVVDDSGQPLQGVKVDPFIRFKNRPGDTRPLGVGTIMVTDSKGEWRYDSVPASMSEVRVAVNHPAYQPLWRGLLRKEFEVKRDVAPTGRIELMRGLTVSGTVTDESGQPIEGALVRTWFINEIRKAITDARGVYRLVGCAPRIAQIIVTAKGRAMDMRQILIDPEMEPVNFSMKPGGKIRVRVVDEQGNAIPKAFVSIQWWRGTSVFQRFDLVVSHSADENGVWEWNEAPLDELTADIGRIRGMRLLAQSLIAREQEYVFTSPRELIVSGSVVDAITKEPIEKFRVTTGVRLRSSNSQVIMQRFASHSYEANNGKYRIRERNPYPAHLVGIEAQGYRDAISRNIMSDEGKVVVNFELERAEEIAATILTAAGEVAANAKIILKDAVWQTHFTKRDTDDRSVNSAAVTRLNSDADGRVSISARDEPFQLVITHPAGVAHLESVDGRIPSRITLTPWARAEGTFRVGAKPVPNVVLSLIDHLSKGDDAVHVYTFHEVTTDEDGRFVVERVFPGKGRIGRLIPSFYQESVIEVSSSLMVSAQFIAGKTTTINLGGTGRPVVGKLAPPADYSEQVYWGYARVHAEADVKGPGVIPVPEDVRDTLKRQKAWVDAWKATEKGKAFVVAYKAYEQRMSKFPEITATVDRDGSFRVDDVPAGDYVLRVKFEFGKQAPGVLSDYRFSVPAAEAGRAAEPVDLGTLTLDKQ